MTRNEISEILQILQLNYPQSFKGWGKDQSSLYAQMWFEAFKDVPKDIMVQAVKSIIYGDKREFAPNIGQVNAKIYELFTQDEMSPDEAWSIVRNAIKRSGWYSLEQFNNLPENLRRIVGSPAQLEAWSQCSSEQVSTVIASNFMKSYREQQSREKSKKLMDYSLMIGSSKADAIESNKANNLIEN